MKKIVLIMVVLALVLSLALPQRTQAHGGGWWVPGAFFGGLLFGTAIARPWYYYPPPVYAYPPPAYAYPPPHLPMPIHRQHRRTPIRHNKLIRHNSKDISIRARALPLHRGPRLPRVLLVNG